MEGDEGGHGLEKGKSGNQSWRHPALTSPYSNPVAPYPGWRRHIYRLCRPVTTKDVKAFLGNEDPYTRDTAAGPVHIIHKFGLIEINALVGEKSLDIWSDPERGAYPSEYLDALLATRFQGVF